MGSRGRILILNERDTQNPKGGGAEVHVQRIFGRLAERGFEVTLAASTFPGASPRVRLDGLDVRRMGSLPRYYSRIGFVCRRETRSGRFDLVVECLNKVPFFSPLYSAVPVLAICHHLFGEVAFRQVPWPIAAGVWTAERPIPWVYRKVPIVTISESSRKDLIRRGLSPDQVRVSHCGIDPPTTTSAPIAERAALVVYVGRLERYKNIDVMLRALASLRDAHPTLEAVVIGQGGARPELEALAAELGIADRVRFAGFVSDEERDTLLGSARVCVFPSDKEGWGLTVIEANALGTPVVATDAAGLRDSVRPNETGFLVPHRDTAAFASRIGQLLSDEPLATRMSAASVAWASRFDWDSATDEMEDAIAACRSAG